MGGLAGPAMERGLGSGYPARATAPGSDTSRAKPAGCSTCGSRIAPCRRRGCRSGLYASDVRILALANLNLLRSARLIVQTAPGSSVLSWDTSRCTHGPRVTCSGRRGCRVDEGQRLRWERAFGDAMRRCRQRVVMELRRQGLGSPYVAFVDENQQRGVLHRNLIVEDGPAGIAFQALWAKHAAAFPALGFVDRRPRVMHGLRAGVYLSSYVTGAKGEASMEARLLRANPHVRVYYCTPRLTSRTRVTMRTLRNGRRLWACEQGLCGRPSDTCKHSRRRADGQRVRWCRPLRGCPQHGYGVRGGELVCMATGEVLGSIWGEGP